VGKIHRLPNFRRRGCTLFGWPEVEGLVCGGGGLYGGVLTPPTMLVKLGREIWGRELEMPTNRALS